MTGAASMVLATVAGKRARLGALRAMTHLTRRAIVLATTATLCMTTSLGAQTDVARADKATVADSVWDAVVAALS